MKDLPVLILGILLGTLFTFIIIATVQSDSQMVNNKAIIDLGCGYHNSDKKFVFKDECKKYYQGVK